MTGNIVHHSSIRQLAALALLTILFSAVAVAQPTTSQTPAPKANLIIERQAVRFDLQGAARSWQLEVFNQSGDLIFASGVVIQPTLEWALADGQEKPLADGLYAYTLKFWNENNEAMATQRGHYLHPKLFGQSEEKSVEWARHPELMKRMKAEREQRRR